jgi:pyruvate dehydrogenase E1 component alpha subunit
MPGIQVDGNDILAVYAAAQEAAVRAREGRGPTLIECVTYRMAVHTTADDPKRYRAQEEVEAWEKRDPIDRFQKYLTHKGLLTENTIESLESNIKTDIQLAVEGAEERMKSLGDPLDMFEHAYAKMPPGLEQQKKELQRELAARDKEADHG